MSGAVTCVLCVLAPAYSIGALDGDELARFESHLLDGCAVCEADLRDADRVVGLLAESVEATPRPALRDELMGAIAQEAGPSGAAWDAFLGGGCWQPHEMPGVLMRVLHVDQATREVSVLLRAESGALYPAHRHTAVEELLMLAGTLRIGDRTYGPGAYIRSVAGSEHQPGVTPDGCMFLLRTSLDDEPLG